MAQKLSHTDLPFPVFKMSDFENVCARTCVYVALKIWPPLTVYSIFNRNHKIALASAHTDYIYANITITKVEPAVKTNTNWSEGKPVCWSVGRVCMWLDVITTSVEIVFVFVSLKFGLKRVPFAEKWPKMVVLNVNFGVGHMENIVNVSIRYFEGILLRQK